MPNIKLTLQYDGTRYLGWTRPAADGYAKTISYRISSVLQKMTGEDITLFAGAKTAPGVHALCQTVNFHTESPFSDTYFLSKLNEYLPKDIHILSSEIVSDRFRSDLNAVSRTYLYRICTAPVQNIFTRAYTANIPEIISESEVAAIRKAADSLVGVHDFRSLSGVKKKKGTVKEIFDISVSHSKETENDSFSLLTIKICANDFLYLMPEHIIEFLIKKGVRIKGRKKMSVSGSNHWSIRMILVDTMPGSAALTVIPRARRRSASSMVKSNKASLVLL